jgi:hypothetical protein
MIPELASHTIISLTLHVLIGLASSGLPAFKVQLAAKVEEINALHRQRSLPPETAGLDSSWQVPFINVQGNEWLAVLQFMVWCRMMSSCECGAHCRCSCTVASAMT